MSLSSLLIPFPSFPSIHRNHPLAFSDLSSSGALPHPTLLSLASLLSFACDVVRTKTIHFLSHLLFLFHVLSEHQSTRSNEHRKLTDTESNGWYIFFSIVYSLTDSSCPGFGTGVFLNWKCQGLNLYFLCHRATVILAHPHTAT